VRIKEDYTEEAAVAFNIISLIDIVFFLLIFFLAATTFAREERDQKVQLPGTAAPKPLSAAPQQVIVNILADGTVKLGARVVSFKELGEEMARVAGETPKRDVLIRADKDSRHYYFAEVVNTCRASGVNPVNIGYIYEKGGAAAVP
jgi:biopolymer transport protein ExbD